MAVVPYGVVGMAATPYDKVGVASGVFSVATEDLQTGQQGECMSQPLRHL